MCLACIEIAKETLKPKDLVKNVLEMLNAPDDDHKLEFIKVLDALSPDYQKEVEEYISNSNDNDDMGCL